MDEIAGKSVSTKRILLHKLLRFSVAFILLLCVFFLLNAREIKSGGTLPRLRGFIVLSGSMSPTFGAGSYIVVKETKPEDIQVGDILTYSVDGGAVLTHRVVESRKENGVYVFQTQGDANNTPDEKPVTQDKIIGTAVLWVNGLGSLLMLLRQPKSIAVIFALACLILLMCEVLKAAKRKNAPERNPAARRNMNHEGGGNIEEKRKKAGACGVRDGSDTIENEKG